MAPEIGRIIKSSCVRIPIPANFDRSVFFGGSDDDRPYSSGSLGEEDRLVIAEDFLIKKEDPDGLCIKKEVTVKKERKKQNRFNGLTEEELSKRLLPDLIAPDLDILIVS